VGLGLEDFQLREEPWVIADLIGKGKHIRTVPVPLMAKRAVVAFKRDSFLYLLFIEVCNECHGDFQ
jgi:hypothetical protein